MLFTAEPYAARGRYVGLTLTTASTYQMLRGSVIIFTGLLSSVYLKRKQHSFHWFGMLFVVAGATIVGVASMLQAEVSLRPLPTPLYFSLTRCEFTVRSPACCISQAGQAGGARNPLLGNLLVVVSQLFTALQMCLEERCGATPNPEPHPIPSHIQPRANCIIVLRPMRLPSRKAAALDDPAPLLRSCSPAQVRHGLQSACPCGGGQRGLVG